MTDPPPAFDPGARQPVDAQARSHLARLAAEAGFDLRGGGLRRTSSRICLSVEHGDYNGTELFGVGVDRFLWLAFQANDRGALRALSGNFAGEGRVECRWDNLPPPRSPATAGRWARFALGAAWVLRRAGFPLRRGVDLVLWSDIPGGGMSRSASLSINLILTLLEVHGVPPAELAGWGMRIVDWAREVENDYIGSPCGELDQVMIYFARAGSGTHYRPRERSVSHVALPAAAADHQLVCMDTGTVRGGLEHATYPVRRAECEQLVALAAPEFGIRCLADVRSPALYRAIRARFAATHPALCDRLAYVYQAQRRLPRLLAAWRRGDFAAVGAVLRADGRGLRDLYRISGPELDSMCEIARSVPGVLGERMLGGGDVGAAAALARTEVVPRLHEAVAREFPHRHPALAGCWSVHACRTADGVVSLPGL